MCAQALHGKTLHECLCCVCLVFSFFFFSLSVSLISSFALLYGTTKQYYY